MSDSQIAAVLETLNRIESRVTRLQDEVVKRTDLVQLRVDTMNRLDRLADRLTAIQDDIAVNYGGVDQVRLGNKNTRDELLALNDTVSSMLKQIQRLQNEVREMKGEAR